MTLKTKLSKVLTKMCIHFYKIGSCVFPAVNGYFTHCSLSEIIFFSILTCFAIFFNRKLKKKCLSVNKRLRVTPECW